MISTTLPDNLEQTLADPHSVLPGSLCGITGNWNRSIPNRIPGIRKMLFQRAVLWVQPNGRDIGPRGLLQHKSQWLISAVACRQVYQRHQYVRQPSGSQAFVSPDVSLVSLATHLYKFGAVEFSHQGPARSIHGFEGFHFAHIRPQSSAGIQIQFYISEVRISWIGMGRTLTGTPIRVIKAGCHVHGMHAIQVQRAFTGWTDWMDTSLPILRAFQSDKLFWRKQFTAALMDGLSGHGNRLLSDRVTAIASQSTTSMPGNGGTRIALPAARSFLAPIRRAGETGGGCV